MTFIAHSRTSRIFICFVFCLLTFGQPRADEENETVNALPITGDSTLDSLNTELLIRSPILQDLEKFEPQPSPDVKPPINITLEELQKESSKQPVVPEANIVILKVVDYRDSQHLKIDSNSRITLSERVLNAIDHEVLINFKIQLQLTEANRIMGVPYQRTRKDLEYHVQLFAYGVNRQYMLYNSRNSQMQTFRQLEPALETLSTLKGFEIAELSELHPKQKYTLRMRISLDRWKLPAPLLLEALFSQDWKLDSGWFEVSLTAPQSWQ